MKIMGKEEMQTQVSMLQVSYAAAQTKCAYIVGECGRPAIDGA